MPLISKSKYLNGLQCHKLLWYNYNKKEDIPEPDPATMLVFEQGQQVGQLAKQLFPDGVDVTSPHDDFSGMLRETQELLKLRRPIFEAAFRFKNGFARADILNPVDGDGWDVIEVKSSTKLKDVNLYDLALQKYVYDGAGLKINRCHLMLINNKYVRKGEIEPKKLFKQEDVTDQVKILTQDIEQHLNEMLNVIQQKQSPDITIGKHCSEPYNCPLQSLCWQFLPNDNVTELYKGGKKQYDLISKNILRLVDIPNDFRLTNNQKIQVEAARTGKPHIDAEKIQEFLATLKYPIYFLDFETFTGAVPLIDIARPYQQIPFQYSLHVLNSLNEQPVHYSYLADGPIDPRPDIMSSLKKLLGSKGTILTFNKSFEIARLKEMSRDYPEYKSWFEKIEPRIADLIVPFRQFAYYHPDQEGAASLKSVLPAITGKSYAGLNIRDGGTASQEFLRVTFGAANETEKNQVIKDLEIYCGLDTSGMIDILIAIKELI